MIEKYSLSTSFPVEILVTILEFVEAFYALLVFSSLYVSFFPSNVSDQLLLC